MPSSKLRVEIAKGLFDRYPHIGKSSVLNRIDTLKLPTFIEGRKRFISFESLQILDELDKWLKENPKGKIATFIEEKKQSFSQSVNVNRSLSRLSNLPALSNTDSLTKRDSGSLNEQVNNSHSFSDSFIQSVNGSVNQQREVDLLKKEIAELKQTNQFLNKQIAHVDEVNALWASRNGELQDLLGRYSQAFLYLWNWFPMIRPAFARLKQWLNL